METAYLPTVLPPCNRREMIKALSGESVCKSEMRKAEGDRPAQRRSLKREDNHELWVTDRVEWQTSGLVCLSKAMCTMGAEGGCVKRGQ